MAFGLGRWGLRRLSALPGGCFSWRVPDHHSEPLLHQGDYAVLDGRQTQPTSGHIFLIGGSTDHEWLAETSSDIGRLERTGDQVYWRLGAGRLRKAWWIGSPGRPRTREQMEQWQRLGRLIPLSDGPLERSRLASMIQGKLVGVLVGEHAISEARVRNATAQAKREAERRKQAEQFDPALHVWAMDQTGSIMFLQMEGTYSAIVTSFVRGRADRGKIYADYADNFDAHTRGGSYSQDRLSKYLIEVHRTVDTSSGKWTYDPDFPPEIRDELELHQANLAKSIH